MFLYSFREYLRKSRKNVSKVGKSRNFRSKVGHFPKSRKSRTPLTAWPLVTLVFPPASVVEGIKSVPSVCVCVCASVSSLPARPFDIQMPLRRHGVSV